MKRKFRIKHDVYRDNRGGESALLVLYCRNCGQKLMLYQKDHPRGYLKRLYLDRIYAPVAMTRLQHMPISRVPQLICPQCHHIIALPYIHPKEKRKAYMIEVASLLKKKSNGTF
jgi:hypothetical protein